MASRKSTAKVVENAAREVEGASTERTEWGGSALRQRVATAEGRIALAEDLLRIRTKMGGVEPLRANAAQMLFEQHHRRESIVLKARQMGLSTWIAGRFFLRAMALPGTVTVHVAHTREAATALFRMVGRMWANLPEDMRANQAKLLRNNAGEMVFAAGDSEIRVVSAAEPNAGRGLTIHQLHVSELSRWQGDAAETLAGLRAALAPGGELVMESTPNGAFGCFYEQWVAAERNGVTRHFFPWWIEPGYVSQRAVDTDSLSEDEAALMSGPAALRLEQIAFRRELAERYGPLRLQEFAEDPATCFRESGACVFESRVLLRRMAALRGPIERRRNGAVEIYWPPQPGRRYVVAIDPAGGGEDSDFSTAQVVDRASGMQCAEMQARFNPRDTARAAAELAREYGGALLVVERNNHGAAVMAYLERESGFQLYRGPDGDLGWLTTSASRDSMLGALQVLLSNEAALVQSGRLLTECRSFVDKKGRMEAAAGAHDDLVMAMAIAQAVRREGRKRE
ncbi:terminase [Terriglobus aquaticus]|uniref:Terminase n=1 Tax=Terriglobus aquaticus TaxID=940139 RepID=A0ABW9KF54_9BACT|nr:terminase [Terriglobus aquaticus]